jgi:branched-chain amino acid transport system ATP-binding protein
VSLLDVKGVNKHFGGVPALSNVTLNVDQGEILGLIGPNGAGKTTLFNVITGFLSCDSGKVFFQDQDITRLRSHVIARKGIVRTFQQLALWRELTVADNVRNALYMRSNLTVPGSFFNTSSYRHNVKAVTEEVQEVLKFVGMEDRANQRAKNLSHGYQKTLSLAIGLAARPTLLLLDEPLAALNPERCSQIVALMRSIREKGGTILVIEHNMRAIFEVCDRIVVLDAGVNIAAGSPAEIREHEQVIAAYLGGGSHA